MIDNSHDRYRLLRYLDAPSKWAFWTTDEALTFAIPTVVGLSISKIYWALAAGFVSYYSLKIIKSITGELVLSRISYWYFPTSSKNFHICIPSHIREFIG